MEDLNAFARALANVDVTREVPLTRFRNRLVGLTSWGAVIEFALGAQALSKAWADELHALDADKRFAKFVDPKDDRVRRAADLRLVPVGAFIAFIRVDEPDAYQTFLGKRLGRRHLVHAMVSLGGGFAAGVNNKRGIGIGNDGRWEVLDLAALCVWTGQSVSGVPLGTQQARPLHVRFRRPEAFDAPSGREATSVSIDNLTLDLLKRVAIQPMQGVQAQNTEAWSLVEAPTTERVLLVQNRGTGGFGGGGWTLTNDDLGAKKKLYFLPWFSQRIVKLKLGHECTVFVTAAIVGCSVFTRGSADAPTVFHAGIDATLDEGAFDKQTGELAEGLLRLFSGARYNQARQALIAAAQAQKPAFWRLLVERLQPGIGQDPGWSEVNKEMYGDQSRRGKAVSDKIAAFHAAEITDFEPRYAGAYIGFSTNGNWSMVLQENLMLSYRRTGTDETYQATFPIALTQVYPPGREGTQLITPLPDRIAGPFTPSETVVRTTRNARGALI